MFIHIGEKKIVSDKNIVGIFNVETIVKSELNDWLVDHMEESFKVISIGINNDINGSNVSPFTIINRNLINKEELIWSIDNAKKL